MNKTSKKIILIALIFIGIIAITNTIYALENTDKYYVHSIAYESGEFGTLISKVVGVIIAVGIVVAVGGILIIGIQAMTGSVQEKAEYQKKILPFIIGFIILICCIPIVGTIRSLLIDDPIEHQEENPFDGPHVAP